MAAVREPSSATVATTVLKAYPPRPLVEQPFLRQVRLKLPAAGSIETVGMAGSVMPKAAG